MRVMMMLGLLLIGCDQIQDLGMNGDGGDKEDLAARPETDLSGETGDGGETVSACATAKTPAEIALPQGYAERFPDPRGHGGASCITGQSMPGYFLADLYGNGRSDLIVTESCKDGTVGLSRWMVHKNSGATFAAAATPFSLPGDFPVLYAYTPAAFDCAQAAGQIQYWIRDMDGDRRPDLLVTQRCGSALVGRTKWLLYRNTGNGFAAPADFALPGDYTGGLVGKSDFLGSGATYCTNGESFPRFGLADMDGDRRPDLIVTGRCGDVTVGVSRWLVYRNSGTGFATSPTPYDLPADYGAPFANSIGQVASNCQAGQRVPGFFLADLSGAGRPDLVITASCTDPSLGQDRWLVHRNDGMTFARAATSFSLPGEFPVTYSSVLDPMDCRSGPSVKYWLTEINGDSLPDLLVTRRCGDLLVGATRWQLYQGRGSGFAPRPVSLELPGPGEYSGGFFGQADFLGSDATACMNGQREPRFGALDVDGDRRPDIVVTGRCGDVTVGLSRWLLYRTTCM